MIGTSWVEICVSDFEQSIAWFEKALGFRVTRREGNEFAELALGETVLLLASDESAYYRQVSAAFHRDVPLIADALAEVKHTADRLAQQRDYLGAATVYETLVTEIFEESHLYYNEDEEERDDYYNDYYDEEPSYP